MLIIGGGVNKDSKDEITHQNITPHVFTNKKYTSNNNRRRYSYEVRQVAKECFEKSMTLDEIAAYMEVDRMTVYKWKRAYEQGRFYVNEQEHLVYAHATQISTFDPLFIEKRAYQELSVLGFSDRQIASAIHVPVKSLSTLKKLEERKALVADDGLESTIASQEVFLHEAPKTSGGRYTTEVRQAAKECFEKGYGYKFTSKRLGISLAVARDWCRLFKEGRFKAEK